MGKKRAKKKGGAAKPPDPRTLPFLQDMFPNLGKDIVEIIFEQNEYDEEKTMQQLSEISDDPEHRPEFVGDGDLDESLEAFNDLDVGKASDFDFDAPTHTDTFSSTYSTKEEPFISTHEPHYDFSTPSYGQAPTSSQSKSEKSSVPISFPSHTTPFFNTTSNTTIQSNSTSSQSTNSMATGESGAFLSSMFPELDPTMVSLLYEENGSDVGKTVESLLSIVFMNHSGTNNEEEEEEADELDEIESDALAEVADSEEEVRYEGETESDTEGKSSEEIEVDEEDEEDEDDSEENEGEWKGNTYEFEAGEFKYELSKPVQQEDLSESVSVASKSEFIQNLKLLAELFPETPRTLLALELDEHDGNLEKTIASCCRADPEYLRKLSGEKALPNDEVPHTMDEKPKGPSPAKPLMPSWLKKGASSPGIKYVPPTKPKSTKTTRTRSKASTRAKNKIKSPKIGALEPLPMDLAAKLKLKQLREKFSFVDPVILEEVFIQSQHKVHATLVCLFDIYPHLRDNSGLPPNSSIFKKNTKSTTTTTTTTTSTSTTSSTSITPTKQEKKPKIKKPKPDNEEDEGEFVMVSYRNKRKSEGTGGSAPTPVKKKVLDSEDIENNYQAYREQAIKASEMRNLLFMQAAAAFSSGDGARAKALSQRGREYDAKMKEAHSQACHQIFIDCNARFDTLASVDLHGLHVSEALQVLSQLLEIHNQMGETNNKPKRLRVITGVGKHSLHGIAKIKPAVKNFLRSKAYTFAESEAGVITISLSRS